MTLKDKKVRMMTMGALFAALEIMLAATPLGFLKLGIIGATTLHIPVIMAAITMGKGAGAALGLVFGLASVVNATVHPIPTSFVFSPFAEFAGVSGGIPSLIVAIVPRVLTGFLAGWTWECLSRKNSTLAITAAAVVGTLTNTVLVLCGIYVFFGPAYAQAMNIAYEALIGMILTVVATNGVAEIILAVAVSLPICKALQRAVPGMMPAKKRQ